MCARSRYGSSGPGYGSSPLFGHSRNDGYDGAYFNEAARLRAEEVSTKRAEEFSRAREERKKRLQAEGVTLPGIYSEASGICDRLETKRRISNRMPVEPEAQAGVDRLNWLYEFLITDVDLLNESLSKTQRANLRNLAERCSVALWVERIATMDLKELRLFERTGSYQNWDRAMALAFRRAIDRRGRELAG